MWEINDGSATEWDQIVLNSIKNYETSLYCRSYHKKTDAYNNTPVLTHVRTYVYNNVSTVELYVWKKDYWKFGHLKSFSNNQIRTIFIISIQSSYSFCIISTPQFQDFS